MKVARYNIFEKVFIKFLDKTLFPFIDYYVNKEHRKSNVTLYVYLNNYIKNENLDNYKTGKKVAKKINLRKNLKKYKQVQLIFPSKINKKTLSFYKGLFLNIKSNELKKLNLKTDKQI